MPPLSRTQSPEGTRPPHEPSTKNERNSGFDGILPVNPITTHQNDMKVRFSDIFKHQTIDKKLVKHLVFIHIHNIIEEDLFELPLWQYGNENFKE